MKYFVGFAGLIYGGFSFAHIKPFEHNHVGFLHPEEMAIVLGAMVLAGMFMVSPLRRKLLSFLRR